MIKEKNPLYLCDVDKRVSKKLETISNKTGIAKWVIAEKILADSFGIKTERALDLSKWTKK